MPRTKQNYQTAIQTLGLKQGASSEEIKDAYRNLAKQYHPDIYQWDNGEKFKEINAAYRFLKKHPDPPVESHQYQTRSETFYTTPGDDYQAKRRAYFRNKRANEAARKKELFVQMFKFLKPFVIIVAVFNCLLVIDYLLLNLHQEETTVYKYNTYSRNGGFFGSEDNPTEYAVYLSNGKYLRLMGNQPRLVNKDEKYILEATLILKVPRLMIRKQTAQKLWPAYGVYNVFWVLIPFIFVLQYFYFYRVKNSDLRLGLIAFMLISFMMQAALYFG